MPKTKNDLFIITDMFLKGKTGWALCIVAYHPRQSRLCGGHKGWFSRKTIVLLLP